MLLMLSDACRKGWLGRVLTPPCKPVARSLLMDGSDGSLLPPQWIQRGLGLSPSSLITDATNSLVEWMEQKENFSSVAWASGCRARGWEFDSPLGILDNRWT